MIGEAAAVECMRLQYRIVRIRQKRIRIYPLDATLEHFVYYSMLYLNVKNS